jgi:acyl-[acyl-carrier-protein]-phospholipid O-acyltransferase/long-chain-fatty-acid--[acyl-carrier-protein] ligase
LKLEADAIFLFIGIGLAAVGVLQMILQPETFVWMVVTFVTKLIYRVRVIGIEHIPAQGGVLITPNHISLVDALFLIASSPRPLRFVIDKAWYDRPILRPIFRALRLIPIASGSVRGALQAAQEAVKNGDAVVIFPEGELTRTGNIQRFRPGLERIAKEAGVPILPVHLDRLWGSIFSHKGGQIVWKVPRKIPFPVTVTYGEPLPSDSTAFQVRQAVTYLATLGFRHRLEARRPLGHEFVRRAKRSPFRFAMSDSMGMKANFFMTLVKASILSRLIRELCQGQKMVGILFPPSVVGALCNIACQLAGKIPVNLNWTVGKDAFEAAIRKCDLKVVLTSQKVLEKLNLERRPEYCFVEDFAPKVGLFRKLWWTIACFCLPTSILTWILCDRQSIDDDATIIFSSGSTAEPKGIRLTHANILSNCLGVSDVFPLTKEDRILGALPFFHSFGFTITIWLPLLGGYGVSYHPNPLDGRGVGKRVRESGATMMTATPTFLQIYTRQCEAEDLKTVRHVIVGAEKLQTNVAEAFEKKFGITPREGYGCTELSPVVSVNAPDVAGPSGRQVATRVGTIGRPLPGVAVRVVDPETYKDLAPGEQGLVLVKGSNVMAGYLNDPERTNAVMKDGWYITGDIAKLDEDGFITITDRLSRFSKIGGEMVPHVKVEEAIQELTGKSDRVVVVAAVSDPDKGERLVVLHTEPFVPSQIISGLREKGFPSLWIPKPDSFYKIDEIPILGSGKINLSAVKEMAKTKASA